jgi:phosphoglycolate phosphatase-like HAD superfamily hydrolase
MQTIEALLVELVGCLAEFPSAPFNEIAVRVFARKRKANLSASRSYWRLLNLIDGAETPFDAEKKGIADALEIEAVDAASIYEDVAPAFAELKSMGIRVIVASSLSRSAATRFIERNSLGEFLSVVRTRDEAGGVKSAPILSALSAASLPGEKAMFLTDTLEGIKVARTVGVHPILMMSDSDEAQRLAMHNPAGGVVSLHEMPDFFRLLAAQNQRG